MIERMNTFLENIRIYMRGAEFEQRRVEKDSCFTPFLGYGTDTCYYTFYKQ